MDLTIVKSNDLIENFIFNATELELQILNYAVAITNPYWDNVSEDYVYKISISELVSVYKTKSKNAYKVYKEALERLQIRTYRYFKQDKEITENVLSKVLRNVNDNSYLELSFNKFIANRIQNLKGFFTQYDIKYIAMFRSRYSFLLYEFFKMNLQKINHEKFSQKISINDFRKDLILEKKYSIFAELKRNVLEKSKAQINRYSDIHINYEVIKTGRTPTHIKFTAKYKKSKSPGEVLDTQKSQTKIENLKNNISDVLKHQPLSEDQIKLRKEKWQSVKEKLKNKL